jgi:hypothetical protein
MHRNPISLTAPERTHPRPAKLVMLEARRQARRELLHREAACG